MDRYDMESDAKWGTLALLRPEGQWVHYLHAAEAIAAETARADREAAARQEAERERDLAIAHDRQPYPTAEAYERVCKVLEARTAERDRLRAELAALRGATR